MATHYDNNNNNNDLVLGGFKFSKMHNGSKALLVYTVNSDGVSGFAVVPSEEKANDNQMKKTSNRKRTRGCPFRRVRNQEEDLEAKAMRFCRIVNKHLRRERSSCFTGYEVIYKMVSSGLCQTRSEALALGQKLSKTLRLFYAVKAESYTFSDDGTLYQFRPEVLLSVIMKTPMSLQRVTPEEHPTKNKAPKKKRSKKNRKKKNSTKTSKNKSCAQFSPSLEKSTIANGDRVAVVDKKDVSCIRFSSLLEDSSDDSSTTSATNSITDDEISIYTEITIESGALCEEVVAIEEDNDDASYMELTVYSEEDCSEEPEDDDSECDEFAEYEFEWGDSFSTHSRSLRSLGFASHSRSYKSL